MRKTLRRLTCLLLLCAALTVVFPASASADFSDVPANHWAAAEIAHCAELGVFGGVSPDRFGLGQSMTRSAFAVVLCRFFDWDTSTARQIYPDVPVDAWYAGAVTAAYDHGAFTLQRAEFRPREAITREELAVALIRALGYTSLSGLAQTLDHPFTDVTTNAGYITLAYDLELLGGTSATTFSPARTATREQVAVIFSRLYRKLHDTVPATAVVLPAGAALPDALLFGTAAISGARLTSAGVQFSSADKSAAAETLQAVHAANAVGLLYVEGRATALRADPAAAAGRTAAAVEESGFDGVFLSLSGLTSSHTAGLTALVQALDSALGEKQLYLAVDASPWGSPAAYHDPALVNAVDRLVLRVAPRTESSGSTMIAPVEPLEDVYYALRTLQDSAAAQKLSLLLTTTGSAWTRTSAQEPLSADEITALLDNGASRHYSVRYACAYLIRGSSTVWYLDGQAVNAREQLCRFFGADQLWLSDGTSVLPEVSAALS